MTDIAADAATEPATGPAAPDPAASEMTRLLCAGTRLDPGFGRDVIDLLARDRTRFAAPAYGYDAVPVLGHALDARRLRRMRNGIAWFCLVLLVVLMSAGVLGVLPGILLLVWVVWAAAFGERLVTLQIVLGELRRAPGAPATFRGQYPYHDAIRTQDAADIRAEQDTRGSLVYFGSYLPFVGAGERTRSWQFAVLLDPKKPDGAAEHPVRPAEPVPFTVDDLFGHLADRLERVLAGEVDAEQRVDELTIERRWYRKAVGAIRPDPAERATPAGGQHGRGLYETAREYLCVRVGSWDGELVTSVFVGFDVKGRTLYSELHGCVLAPIRPAFRQVDHLPERVDAELLGRLAGNAFRSVLGGFQVVARKLRPNQAKLAPGDLVRYADGGVDWGARTSIRELAATDEYQHAYQELDAQKYLTVVERRLLEVVLDFLEEHEVDTGEYRDRQATVLNYGIMHSGTGNIVNSGAQAVGPDARTERKDPA